MSSLCFREAAWARKSNAISPEVYLVHLMAHLRGVRHAEDNKDDLPILSTIDPISASVKRMILTPDFKAVQDTTIYERIMMGCISGSPADVESLSQQMKANDSKVPLQPMTAAAAVHENAKVFRYCLSQGAVFDLEVDKASARASTPPMLKLLYDANWRNIKTDHDALDKALTSSVGKGQSCVAFLLDQGARIQPTTLSTAAFNPPSGADIPTMALLLSRGGQQKNSGALQLAAGRGRLDMVKLLLDEGADIDEIATNAPGDRMNGWPATALHEAIAGSCVEVVRYLLARGARPDVRKRDGQTAVELARSRGQSQILEMLAPQIIDE